MFGEQLRLEVILVDRLAVANPLFRLRAVDREQPAIGRGEFDLPFFGGLGLARLAEHLVVLVTDEIGLEGLHPAARRLPGIEDLIQLGRLVGRQREGRLDRLQRRRLHRLLLRRIDLQPRHLRHSRLIGL